MLYIENLHAQIEGKEILKGINLKVLPNKVYAIMGPNGGGKSTLAQVLAGHPDYKVTDGWGSLDEQDFLAMTPDERFQAGLFLSFQYPVEIAGVNFVKFLHQAHNEKLKHIEGSKRLSPIMFRQLVQNAAERLGFTEDITKRPLNMGFSGGEKKKLEIIQMSILKPEYVILDEPDSGLDVDALRLIGKELKFQMAQRPFGLIIITHYQKILDYIEPDEVHVLMDGKIVKKGDKYLAKEIEKEGYDQFR